MPHTKECAAQVCNALNVKWTSVRLCVASPWSCGRKDPKQRGVGFHWGPTWDDTVRSLWAGNGMMPSVMERLLLVEPLAWSHWDDVESLGQALEHRGSMWDPDSSVNHRAHHRSLWTPRIGSSWRLSITHDILSPCGRTQPKQQNSNNNKWNWVRNACTASNWGLRLEDTEFKASLGYLFPKWGSSGSGRGEGRREGWGEWKWMTI